MDDMTTFERRLASELDRLAGPGRRIDAMAMVRTVSTPSPKRRLQTMFSATKFIVAGAIVALFGGFLLSGNLMRQPSDVPAPAASTTIASPSAQATSDPTSAPEPSTIGDLLPGVSLITEEVEPGVFRVLSDGIRDLVQPPMSRPAGTTGPRPSRKLDTEWHGTIASASNGDVWWFGEEAFRLGDRQTWPTKLDAGAVVESTSNGSLWADRPLLSFSEGSWSRADVPGALKALVRWLQVAPDDTLWLQWTCTQAAYNRASDPLCRRSNLSYVGRGGRTDVEIPAKFAGYADAPFAVAANGEIWMRTGPHERSAIRNRLMHFDGTAWEIVTIDGMPTDYQYLSALAIGLDGTLWAHIAAADDGEETRPYLARLRDGAWTVFSPEDGVPELDWTTGAARFDVAPDGVVFMSALKLDLDGATCDGAASFDGVAWTRYLRDSCVWGMDIAPNGALWLRAGEPSADWTRGRGEIDTYVIEPEAAMAAE